MAADPFSSWKSNQSILDAVHTRQPPSLTRQFEVQDGVTRRIEQVMFADGSSITLTAQVNLPPAGSMQPTRVTVVKPGNKPSEKMDDGSSEAMRLAHSSTAMRLLEFVSKLLDDMPLFED